MDFLYFKLKKWVMVLKKVKWFVFLNMFNDILMIIIIIHITFHTENYLHWLNFNWLSCGWIQILLYALDCPLNYKLITYIKWVIIFPNVVFNLSWYFRYFVIIYIDSHSFFQLWQIIRYLSNFVVIKIYSI